MHLDKRKEERESILKVAKNEWTGAIEKRSPKKTIEKEPHWMEQGPLK